MNIRTVQTTSVPRGKGMGKKERRKFQKITYLIIHRSNQFVFTTKLLNLDCQLQILAFFFRVFSDK